MRALVLALVLACGVLAACGANWFPKCDDPKHPCPNVEPDYPPSPAFATKDAGLDG